MENRTRAGHGNCIKAVSKSTGVTFRGTVEFAGHPDSKFKIGISENVAGLAMKFGNAGSDGDDDSEDDQLTTVTSGPARVHHQPPSSSAACEVFPFPLRRSLACESLTSETLGSRDTDTDAELMSLFGSESPSLLEPGTGEDEGVDQDAELAFALANIPKSLNCNMTEIYNSFGKKGFACLHMHLNNKSFLIPVTRGRLWFLYASFRNMAMSYQDAMDRLSRAAETITFVKTSLSKLSLPFDSFALNDDDPRIRHMKWANVSRWNKLMERADHATRPHEVVGVNGVAECAAEPNRTHMGPSR